MCLQFLEHGVEDPLAPPIDGVLVTCQRKTISMWSLRCGRSDVGLCRTRVAEGEGGQCKGSAVPSMSSAALCASTSFWRTSAAGP